MFLAKVQLSISVTSPMDPVTQDKVCALADGIESTRTELGMNYYPALSYWAEVNPHLESLLRDFNRICQQLRKRSLENVPRCLAIAFVHTQLLDCRTLADQLPPFRPEETGATLKLHSHLNPARQRLQIEGQLWQRKGPKRSLERYAASVASRWLHTEFETVSVLDAQLTSGSETTAESIAIR